MRGSLFFNDDLPGSRRSVFLVRLDNLSVFGIKEKQSNNRYAPLAQLDRALVYGTKGWGFELLMVHQEVIIRIVSSSQVIGSDLLFI